MGHGYLDEIKGIEGGAIVFYSHTRKAGRGSFFPAGGRICESRL